MRAVCYPAKLSGTVAAIPSKSDAHRKLICAALTKTGGVLPLHAPFCDDIAATIRCLQALGAEITETANGLSVKPIRRQAHADLDCGESGSTLRFLLPVAMAVCSDISVTGHGRLPERPIDTLVQAMSAHGVQFEQKQLPLNAHGALNGGEYEIPGNISSQFLSGLLMALPLCDSDSTIKLTTELQSAAYVEMTLRTLRQFGAEIAVECINGLFRYTIKGKQELIFPDDIFVDGDWSNAAFWLAAGAIRPGNQIAVSGLNTNSVQGDRAIAVILSQFGAKITSESGNTAASYEALNNVSVSMEKIPDLLPILAVCAAAGSGKSEFTQAERLRLKESDRLASVAAMLRAIGGTVDEYPDSLCVCGGQLSGGTVDAQNDHRLVMSAAVAASCCTAPVTILGTEAVNKSYPTFFEDYRRLGGQVEFLD